MPLPSQICIVGDSGLLGGALVERAGAAGRPLASRELLAALGADRMTASRAAAATAAPQVWIYASGIIDPKAGDAELEWVNVEAPLRLRDVLQRAALDHRLPPGRIRLVTIGSALEDRPALAAANPYIRSKAALGAAFRRHRDSGPGISPVAWSHIRLHTLYGRRPPPPFMFLGQMEAALRQGTEFAMSAGDQLREYHHADDVAANILAYLDGLDEDRHADLVVLGNGNPIRIGDLAARVFEHFGRSGLLRLGARSAQPGEVFEAAAPRSPHVLYDRDAVAGIIEWLAGLGIRKGAA